MESKRAAKSATTANIPVFEALIRMQAIKVAIVAKRASLDERGWDNGGRRRKSASRFQDRGFGASRVIDSAYCAPASRCKAWNAARIRCRWEASWT